MTLPAKIRVNASVPFPALVQGANAVGVTKANGVWTVGLSYPAVGTQAPPIANYPTDFVLVYDAVQQTYFRASLAAITGGGANPTATAGPTAVNGSAATFMRSDAAPAVQLASPSQFGLAKPDGTTITAAGGVLTAIIGGSGTPGNPTATVGLTAVNGSAATFMRSDAAPPINQAITPTWTGSHTFDAPVTVVNTVTANAVNGVGYIAPGVNGIAGNGTTDDTAAIQAILNAYTNIFIGPGKYLISSTLTITVGNLPITIQGSGAQLNYHATLGYGSYFLAKSSFTGSAAIELNITNANAAVFKIGGFTIQNQTAGSGAATGFYVLNAAGDNQNFISGVLSAGFSRNFRIENSRSITWDCCAAWNYDANSGQTTGEYNVYIFTNGSFCGDMIFRSCLVSSSTSGYGFYITDSSVANGSTAGIKIIACSIYQAYQAIAIQVAGSASSAGDIWITSGTQVASNAGSNTTFGVYISTGGSAYGIQDVHIDGVYFTSVQTNGIIITEGAGFIAAVQITNCFFDGVSNKAIFVDGAATYGVQISGCQFLGILNPGAQAVLINNGVGHTFINNIMYNYGPGSNNVNYFLTIGSSASYVVAMGFSGCGSPASGPLQNLSTNNCVLPAGTYN